MANYLNAFYGATNGFCGVMTSAMYANEIQGKNLISQNNKLLGPDGYKYHLEAGHSVWLPSYKVTCSQYNSQHMTIGQALAELEKFMPEGSTMSEGNRWSLATNSAIIAQFNQMVSQGEIKASSCSFLTYQVSKKAILSPTISQLVNYEASLAKGGASANTMQEWGQQVQAANTAFSNIKNQAQAGVSQVSGWVQTDGDEMTAAVNMLSSVLQGLASPVTVS